MKIYVRRVSIVLALSLFTSTFVSGANAWLPEEFEDDFGTKTFILSTFFDQVTKVQTPDSQPLGSRYAAIGIRCQDSDLSIAFRFHRDGDTVKLWKKKTIDIRINGGKTFAWPFVLGPSNFGWIADQKKFLRKLKKSKTLSIRATDTEGSFVTANFNTQNLKFYRDSFRKYGCSV